MSQYFLFFTIFFLSLALFFIVGGVIFRILAIRRSLSFELLFRNILVGYISLITAYSLIKTSGVSINIIYAVLFLLAAYEVKSHLIKDEKFSILKHTSTAKSIIGVCITAIIFTFSWSWFSSTSGNVDFPFLYNSSDYILYSRISQAIGKTGQENGFYFLNDFDKYYNGAEPYHYFDLWGGALVSSIFSVNHFLALRLVIYPIFSFLVFLAISSLIQPWLVQITMGIMLLFVGGFVLEIYSENQFLSTLGNLKHSLLTPNTSKLAYFYVFFAASYLLWLKQLPVLSCIALFCMPVANIIAFPIIASVLLVAIIGRYKGGLTKSDFHRIILYSGITIIGIVVFYSVFKREAIGLAGANISSPIDLIVSNFTGRNWTTRLNILVGGSLHLTILYFPLIIFAGIVGYVYKVDLKHYAAILIFTFLVILITLICWAIMFWELNSSQVFSNICISLINFLFAAFIIDIYRISHFNKYILFSAIVLLSFKIYDHVSAVHDTKHMEHSPEYLKQISTIVKIKKLLSGASVKDSTRLIEFHEKYNAAYPLGNYLSLINERISVVNIGDFNTPMNSSSPMSYDRSLKAVQNGIFYRYVQSNRDNNPTCNIEDLQLEFIKKHHIQFLISSPKAKFPKWLKANDSVIEDPLTGERFIVINSNIKR